MHIARRVVLVIVAIAAVSAAVAAPRLALAPGDRAPLVTGVELGTGEMVGLDWSTQRVNLVNFWATWCVPCQEEMPALQALHQRFGAEGLGIIGVHRQVEATDREIQEFLNTFGITYRIVRGSPRIGRDWGGLSALPVTFIVDGQGTILRRYVGSTAETLAGLVADVEALMAGRPLPVQIVPEQVRTAVPPDPPRADDHEGHDHP